MSDAERRWPARKWRIGPMWGQTGPQPMLYLRCDSCGKVAPRTVETGLLYTDRDRNWQVTPPQLPCPLCGHSQLRAVGDAIGGPGASVTCGRRMGWMYAWRRCATVFDVPAAAHAVCCPACLAAYPGPAAER